MPTRAVDVAVGHAREAAYLLALVVAVATLWIHASVQSTSAQSNYVGTEPPGVPLVQAPPHAAVAAIDAGN